MLSILGPLSALGTGCGIERGCLPTAVLIFLSAKQARGSQHIRQLPRDHPSWEPACPWPFCKWVKKLDKKLNFLEGSKPAWSAAGPEAPSMPHLAALE